MILVIGHPAFLDVGGHAVQTGWQREFLVFTGDSVLIVQICLDGRVLHEEIQYFIGSFFVLAVSGDTELQVDTGVQDVLFLIVAPWHDERVDVHIRIDGLDLWYGVTADAVHGGSPLAKAVHASL